jgi:hypothetical protein
MKMVRCVAYACACLALTGCIKNDVSTTNAQIMPVGVAAPARPPRVILTSTAQLAKAREIVMNTTTMYGATLILASPVSLAADCTQLGTVAAKVVMPPSHGVVHIAQGTAFPHFVPGDPPYACNAQKSPATIITYRSSRGFSGEDTTAVQIFFPDGSAPTVLFHIAVQ